tara:strand:- start:78 stop:446 length:369 start_codon:yes stop_codon:yes gene_type:complete
MNDTTLNSVSIYHAGQRTDLEVEGEVTGFNLNGVNVCSHNDVMDRLKFLTTVWKMTLIILAGAMAGSVIISSYLVYEHIAIKHKKINLPANRHLKASNTLRSQGYIFDFESKQWLHKSEISK